MLLVASNNILELGDRTSRRGQISHIYESRASERVVAPMIGARTLS